MSKPSARRIVRSRETQAKEFDQAGSKFGSTVFENNRRDSIPTVSLPRIKARQRMENVIFRLFIINIHLTQNSTCYSLIYLHYSSVLILRGMTEFKMKKNREDYKLRPCPPGHVVWYGTICFFRNSYHKFLPYHNFVQYLENPFVPY